jgi:hypothetical protein
MPEGDHIWDYQWGVVVGNSVVLTVVKISHVLIGIEKFIINVLVHYRREKVDGRVTRICLREMYLVSLGCNENGDMIKQYE